MSKIRITRSEQDGQTVGHIVTVHDGEGTALLRSGTPLPVDIANYIAKTLRHRGGNAKLVAAATDEHDEVVWVHGGGENVRLSILEETEFVIVAGTDPDGQHFELVQETLREEVVLEWDPAADGPGGGKDLPDNKGIPGSSR